jgi:glycosyltransferase involved in cell wall biosynthesis
VSLRRQPTVPEVGVVAFVPDYWGPIWETRHHVMSRLAAFFNIVWLDPAHGWRDTRRALRERGPLNPAPPPGLHVARQRLWLPRVFGTPWLDDFTRRKRLRDAVRHLRSLGSRTIVFYIWRPDFLVALDDHRADHVLYHIDDEYAFAADQPSPPSEAVLLERADQVIVHSVGLMEKKGSVNPATVIVPNGVDFARFATPHTEPPDMAGIARPRIGYAGYLKRQLNWELIGELVCRHPDWSFVFAGDRRHQVSAAEEMAEQANVHFLGRKTADQIAAYPQYFDCCIMPYAMTSYTDCIYPMKLHEYLASGRPVVATPIRSLKEFSGVVELATTVDEWSDAIQRNLSSAANTQARRQARQDVARGNEWDLIASRIAEIVGKGVGVQLGA